MKPRQEENNNTNTRKKKKNDEHKKYIQCIRHFEDLLDIVSYYYWDQQMTAGLLTFSTQKITTHLISGTLDVQNNSSHSATL